MNWAAPYHIKRDQYWPEVEQFFSYLPPQLLKQGMLLKNNLATFYAETGQFKDILCRRHDHPLLYWHLWLLDDWACPASTDRTELERRLFLAMVFAFSAVYTQDLILDGGSNFDSRFQFLAQTLHRQADSQLAQLFPGGSPFWDYPRTFWQERAESVLTPDPQPPTPNPRPLAFTKISIVAVALSAEREDLLPQLGAMLDRLNLVFQILQDISTLKRDLSQGRLTYPIWRTAQAADLDPVHLPSPEQVLGALVLTGTVETIGRECLAELEASRAVAESLNLPTFSAYLDGLAEQVNEVRELFSLRARPVTTQAHVISSDPPGGARNPQDATIKSKELGISPSGRNDMPEQLPMPKDRPAQSPRRPLFTPYVDTLPKVIEMAEGYLLSDLTFRESWEIQRRGVFGAAEMTAKAFPMGLIAEILSRHGHDMAAPINHIFDTLQATGWRYYDHPHLPPDADDLGLALRLYSFSTEPERHQTMLQTPLRWLEASVNESGEIPVWLTAGAEAQSDYPFLALWGQSCATVEANVLLGLLAFDPVGYYELIEKSVRQWCERIISQGLSANRHYVSLYALWTAFELLAQLHRRTGLADIQAQLDLAGQTLLEQLSIEANRPYLTPQDAAFLSLACLCLEQRSPKLALATEASALFKPEWTALLCKSQRYDGSWAAEPLYGTPTRGELAAWYSSRPVTTAFCYHALRLMTTRISRSNFSP
ncbi:MAG: hypothetical protein DPW09_18120 [Anaerolineae bacterium]|nr:hypothetical protein [Anaerolineae bacterium]